MEENAQNPQDLVQNPIGDELQVEVSIPKKIEIKMVDASTLSDYEVWFFIASLVCNFLVGFVVATISTDETRVRWILLAVDVFFLLLLIVAIVMVWKKRKGMSIETSTIPLSVKKRG
jgi:hypothetical protein